MKTELEEIYNEIEKQKFINIIYKSIFISLFVFVVVIPKIFLANQNYLISIKINKALNEYSNLNSENQILKLKIKKIKFKNRILILNLSQ